MNKTKDNAEYSYAVKRTVDTTGGEIMITFPVYDAGYEWLVNGKIVKNGSQIKHQSGDVVLRRPKKPSLLKRIWGKIRG